MNVGAVHLEPSVVCRFKLVFTAPLNALSTKAAGTENYSDTEFSFHCMITAGEHLVQLQALEPAN